MRDHYTDDQRFDIDIIHPRERRGEWNDTGYSRRVFSLSMVQVVVSVSVRLCGVVSRRQDRCSSRVEPNEGCYLYHLLWFGIFKNVDSARKPTFHTPTHVCALATYVLLFSEYRYPCILRELQ